MLRLSGSIFNNTFQKQCPNIVRKKNFITVKQNLIVVPLLFQLFYVQLLKQCNNWSAVTVLTPHATKIPSTIRQIKKNNPFKTVFIRSYRLNCTSNCFSYFSLQQQQKNNCIHSQSVRKYESTNDKREFSELNAAHYSRKLSVSFRWEKV